MYTNRSRSDLPCAARQHYHIHVEWLGGNRQYNHDQLKRLFFIKRCRELGFSIAEIRALLQMVDRADITCGEVHAMTVDHLKNVKNKIVDLRRLEKTMKLMAAECSKGDVPDCPIIDTLFGG
jgi:MerR family mercuric resistance operon transcriptional regulator